MTLTGTVTGNSLEALIKQAEHVARVYYSVKCVQVELSSEESVTNHLYGFPTITYTAHYKAKPNLHFSGIAAPTCVQCGKEPS